jgi:hypothetical protein
MKDHSPEEGYIIIDPRENTILTDLNRILEKIDLIKLSKIKKKTAKFGKELKIKLGLKDFDALNYKLWHILESGKSPDDIKDFDTEDRDIEKFIRSLNK